MSSNIRSISTFHNPKYTECIEAYNYCANACEYRGSLCLREECEYNVKMHRTYFYCADVCRFASKYLTGDSSYTKQICETCAKVCEVCAKECERHNMDHCKQCSQVCYECAQVCRSM